MTLWTHPYLKPLFKTWLIWAIAGGILNSTITGLDLLYASGYFILSAVTLYYALKKTEEPEPTRPRWLRIYPPPEWWTLDDEPVRVRIVGVYDPDEDEELFYDWLMLEDLEEELFEDEE